MNPIEQLNLSRRIGAAPARVFEAWTTADQLTKWWGGAGVTCPEAEVDLRPGGSYRIANATPDGNTTWISGVFEVIEPPDRLVYTWSVEPSGQTPVPKVQASVVEVEFQAVDGGTQITINHTRIPTVDARDMFEAGWNGCLDGLGRLLGENP